MSRWDIFISHASEDKADVAEPLAVALRRAGLKVWLDTNELKIGDNLRQNIDDGLAKSRFGVLIVSEKFLQKRWPRRELEGLTALEDAYDQRVILPVWHLVDKATVARASPSLANVIAANTSNGIAAVAEAIVAVATSASGGSPASVSPTPLRLLNKLLDQTSEPLQIVEFFSMHPELIERSLGVSRNSVIWMQELGDVSVDLAGYVNMYTTGEVKWSLVKFGTPDEQLVVGNVLSQSVQRYVSELKEARRWIAKNPEIAKTIGPGLSPDFQGHVISGRRKAVLSVDGRRLRMLIDELPRIEIRTYDWLIDAVIDRCTDT